jgi:phosphonate transport system substrate-binding protein
MRRTRGVRLGLLFWLAALLVGCGSTSNYPQVSLAEPSPSPSTMPATDRSQPPLRVAIAAVISPRRTAQNYAPLLDYLTGQSGRPVESVQGRTYAEVNNLLRDGDVDLAFVCSGAYVQGHRDFGMELLVAPQVAGKTVYYSYIIVPTDSPARHLADLSGKTFAFTDPMSNSGWLMPVDMLRQAGETPESFFKHTIYTYSHDNSIAAVVDGLVDGAAVDSLVYNFAVTEDPTLADRTRVIVRSDACGIPPVVVHPDLGTGQKAALRDMLLTMHQNEAGRDVLASLMIDRFVVIGDSAYDSVRRALDQVKGTP